MSGAPQIPWEEYLATYNRLKKANFGTPQEMVAALYKQEGTLLKVAEILGISDNTISLFMTKHGLPKLPRGHRGNSEFQVAFRKIKNPRQYTYGKLAEMIGCSPGYIGHLFKHCTK